MAWIVMCVVATGAAHAAVVHDSNLSWQTLYSKHFAVHYHQGLEERAREVVAIAEHVHTKLSKSINWTPATRTEIVVTDEFDLSNGYASFFPANRITLFLAAPDAVSSLEDHGGWLETVITHEYVHLLHLDKGHGATRGLRRVFGRFPLLFPNAFEPLWLIEGLATYHESDAERGMGRGQSSFFDMLMRMEVAGGGIKPLRQVNQRVDTWPGGYVPYLYGVQFFNFAAARYGQDKAQRWVENYSDNLVPFRILSNSRQTYGKELTVIWDEFAAATKEKYETQLAKIRTSEQAGERLTTRGYFAGPLRTLADGRAFYLAFDGRSDPTLMVWQPSDRKSKRLAKVHFGARLDVHPMAGILLAQPEICRNTRHYYDLYRLDVNGRGKRRLTHCARYRTAAFSPDGARIVAAGQERGKSYLDMLDGDGKFVERLWSGAEDDVITDLDWSPKGDVVVASRWQRQAGWNLALFTLTERSFRALTSDAAIDAQPQFNFDGTSVLFSSDHGGVYNVRQVDLATSEIATRSHVTGGAFYPAPAPDGAVFYIGYGPAGADLYRLATPASLRTPAMAAGASTVAAPKPEVPAGLRTGEYQTLSGLWPRWWLPHLVVEQDRAEIGATTAGWDALVRHIYAIDAAYDVENNSFVGSVDYIYDRWYPILKLHAARENLFSRNDNEDLVRVRHADTAQAEVVLPLLRYDYRLSAHTAVLQERESDARRERGALPLPTSEDNIFGLALVLDTTKRFPLSVSRSAGREVRLVAEDSSIFNGDFSGKIYTFDWREFVPLGGEHVLAARFVQGWGEDRPRPFRLGGADGARQPPPLLASTLLDSPFNERDYALRGYPEGLAALSGRRMQLGSLEWRFPIRRIERGFMAPPLGLHQIFGSVFVDAGAAWDQTRADYRTGAGFEVSADTALFYSLRLALRLGYAHGFDDGGKNQVYLRVGASF